MWWCSIAAARSSGRCAPIRTWLGWVAEHYAALAGDVHKDRDCHWQIVERWSYGKHLGWFVEHDGYCYESLEAGYGEDGPHPTREAAAACMAEHLRAAIAEARGLGG